MKNKIASMEQIMEKIHDGQTIMFSDAHGGQAADEIIDAMLKKGTKDITAVAITAGNPTEGVGKLIVAHRVKKIITTHTGFNPEAQKQMDTGELEIEYVPQGTWVERMHCAAAGLGGCLTPTGVGTEVEIGKEKLTIDGKEYLLEKPIAADIALLKATKADKAGNIYFCMNSMLGHDTMALAAKFPIFEVEEVVEIGDLGPDTIHIPAPITGYVYLKKRPREIPVMWKKLLSQMEGGKK